MIIDQARNQMANTDLIVSYRNSKESCVAQNQPLTFHLISCFFVLFVFHCSFAYQTHFAGDIQQNSLALSWIRL